MACAQEHNRHFTTQELRDSAWGSKCIVAIRGQVYDFTNFQKVHPGGTSSLQMAAGRDVTVVFETTHNKSALSVLRKYKVGYLLGNQFPLFNPPNMFARTLRTRVEEYFRSNGHDPKYSHDMLPRYLLPLAGILSCYGLLYWNESVSASTLRTSLVLIVWSWSYFGFTVYWVHDGSHASITHNPRVWDAFGLIYNFLMGFSDIIWFYKHVLGHHPYTNIEGVDPDISVEPFFITRFLPSQPWSPIYTRQHIYGPMLYSMLTHFLNLQDIITYRSQSNDTIPMNPLSRSLVIVFWCGKVANIMWCLRYLGPLFTIWTDINLAWAGLFYLYRCVLPVIFSPSSWRRVLTTFFLSEMMISCIAAFVFESNHVVDDILWLRPQKNSVMPTDWVQMQIETTQDYGHDSLVTTLLTGSLNYQVVHHIFPQVNQRYYPEIAKIVKSTCKEFGVNYKVRSGFCEAFGDHLNLLKKMGSFRYPPGTTAGSS